MGRRLYSRRFFFLLLVQDKLMRLEGLSLTLPVCDLRRFLDPSSRQEFLSALVVRPSSTHIRGFGAAKGRAIRLPWRPRDRQIVDTIYFECHGAIRLSNRMPDDQSVANHVRHAYLDGRALVRFEIGLYTDPARRSSPSPKKIQECAKIYWEGQNVKVTDGEEQPWQPFASAIPALIRRFVEKTSLHKDVRYDLCKDLEPQLQVIATASPSEFSNFPCEFSPVDQEKHIHLGYAPLKVKYKASPLDIIYIVYQPGIIHRRTDPAFEKLRLIRAHLSWLHADLELLIYLMEEFLLRKVDVTIFSDYIFELAEGLQNALSQYIADRQILFLAKMPELSARIARISKSIDHLSLSDPQKAQLLDLFHRLAPRLPPTPIKPAVLPAPSKKKRTLNERITEALSMYTNRIMEPGIWSQRYEDKRFHKSAERKAQAIFEKLPKKLDKSRLIFVSVGGADGAELFHLLERTGARYAMLLEWYDKATLTAQEEAKKRGLNVETYSGDLMGKIDRAMQEAASRRGEEKGSAIVVTAHAVLHELNSRSKNFKLWKYFSKLRNADIIMGREPVEPPNWPEKVLISGDFQADLLNELAKIIRDTHDAFSPREKFEPNVVNATTLELHRALAVETLTKVFYSEDFLYELEETVSAFSPEKLLDALILCLGNSHVYDQVRLTSQSISNFWQEHGLKAIDDNQRPLHKPLSHVWYIAIKKDLVEVAE